MNKNEIFNKLIDILKEVVNNLDYSKINLDTKIFDELNLDSISILYMIMSIESLYNVKITNDDVTSMKTIDDLIEFIISRTN